MVAAHLLVDKGEEGEACQSLLLQQLLKLSLAVISNHGAEKPTCSSTTNNPRDQREAISASLDKSQR